MADANPARSGDARTGTAMVIVGRIRRAHGVRGAVVVEPLTDRPAALFAAGRSFVAGTTHGDPSPDGGTLTVRAADEFKDGLIVSFNEVADRDAAGRWRDRYLLLPLDELPPPAEDQVFLHDLVGLAVRTSDGQSLGTVTAFYELPSGLLLEVVKDGESVLLPYRLDFVREVDVANGALVFDPPPGLLE